MNVQHGRRMMLILSILAYVALAGAVPWENVTDLDEYVNRVEDVYSYSLIRSEYVGTPSGFVSVYYLNMTSLRWMNESLTTRPVWWHYQTVVIPDNLVYTDSAILYISSGSNDEEPPTAAWRDVQETIGISSNLGAIVSLVNMIPNQPLLFTDEDNGTRPRSEDALVGYSWNLFLQENITDPEVIAMFPMVKASKLAVDTMFSFSASVRPEVTLSSVMPTGLSKRGWITWLLACVDERVFAMAPIVFDLLDFYPNLQHHYTSLGGWSWAFISYWNVGVSRYLHHPRTRLLGSHIDPLEYNARLTMPKLLSGAAGDDFFLPDSTHLWWDRIIGTDNHYILFDNDDHILNDHRFNLWQNVEAFFISVKDGIQLPQYEFTITQNAADRTGTIAVTSETTPTAVRVWWADSTNRSCEPDDDITGTCRRDFRLARLEIPNDTLTRWTAVELAGQNGTYSATYSEPEEFGYKTFHIEMDYPAPGGRILRLSSLSNVIPNTFPFPICTTELECWGQLK